MTHGWSIGYFQKLKSWLEHHQIQPDKTQEPLQYFNWKFCDILNSNESLLPFLLLDFYKECLSSKEDLSKIIKSLDTFLARHEFDFYQFIAQITEISLNHLLGEEILVILRQLNQKAEIPQFRFLAAWVALNTNNLQDCIYQATKLGNKNADALTIKGQALLESNMIDEGIATLEAATRIDSTQTLAWFQLAKGYYSISRYEESWYALRHCQRLNPNNAEIALFLAILALQTSQKDWLKIAWISLKPHLTDYCDNIEVVLKLLLIAIHLKQKAMAQEVINSADWSKIQNNKAFLANISSILHPLGQNQWYDLANLLLIKVTNKTNHINL